MKHSTMPKYDFVDLPLKILHSGIPQNADFVGTGKHSWSVFGTHDKFGYDTCSGYSEIAAPDKFVITPYINTDPAKRVQIKFEYSLRRCVNSDGAKIFCKEQFEAYAFRASDNTEPFRISNLAFITTLALDPSKSSAKLFSEVWINMEGKHVIMIAFRDQGSCGSVTNLTISYLIEDVNLPCAKPKVVADSEEKTTDISGNSSQSFKGYEDDQEQDDESMKAKETMTEDVAADDLEEDDPLDKTTDEEEED